MKYPWEDAFYDPDYMLGGTGDTPVDDIIAKYKDLIPIPFGVIVDIGCGTGRITLPLLQDGWKVVALDMNPKMLAKLKEQLFLYPELLANTIFQEASLTDVQNLKADAAVACDDFLTHFLSLESLDTAFSAIKNILNPGGYLYTDLRPRHHKRLVTAQAPGPKPLHSFGVSPNVLCEGKAFGVYVIGWDEYSPSARILTSHQQFSKINDKGKIVGTEFKTLRQRLHLLEEVQRAGEKYGLRLEADKPLRQSCEGWSDGHLLTFRKV